MDGQRSKELFLHFKKMLGKKRKKGKKELKRKGKEKNMPQRYYVVHKV